MPLENDAEGEDLDEAIDNYPFDEEDDDYEDEDEDDE